HSQSLGCGAGRTQGLAVDGDVIDPQDADTGVQPAPQAEIQAARGQRGEEAGEGAARGHAVGQVEEGLQPVEAFLGESDDLVPVVGAGDGGAQGDGDDAEQGVVFVTVATARVAQLGEAIPDGNLAVHDSRSNFTGDVAILTFPLAPSNHTSVNLGALGCAGPARGAKQTCRRRKRLLVQLPA